MTSEKIVHIFIVLVLGLFATATSMAGNQTASGETCVGFGPQTPRDIDNKTGENKRIFSKAPSYENLNLCNIHFHVNAEHKAKDFSIDAGDGDHGHGGGFKCHDSKSLTKENLKEPRKIIVQVCIREILSRCTGCIVPVM